MRNRRKENSRYLNFIIHCFIVAILVILTNPARSMAKVTGNCDNCHTMHTSQEGTSENVKIPVNYGVGGGALPASALTKVDCIGCHSNTGSETIKYVGGDPDDPGTSRVPIVYNIQQPVEGTELAGGNFYWVKELGDDRGHNVLAGPGGIDATEGISMQDSELDDAPGRTESGLYTGTCLPCHKYLNGRDHNLNDDQALIDEPYCGCKSCHTNIRKSHHAEDHVSNNPDEYNLIVDHTLGCYRFLKGHEAEISGIHGIESYDWEQSKGVDYPINQYKGSDIDATSADPDHSISDSCGGCHGNFHAKDMTNPEKVNASPWFRHPAHIGLPEGGEFDAYTEYNLDAPVARKNLEPYITPSERLKVSTGSGYGGNDQVMCLSCHRAHASPYPDILRWDYEQVEADDGIENKGCKICHSGKN